jgi:Tol biopolymer transport system component/DNA-binding winged helix-turn-helix (wHTH) protein
VEKSIQNAQVIRFATFEADLRSGELRKSGVKLKFGGQPFQVLAILLEHPGSVVTREELQKRLWPDTFVDVDHNLNTAINKIREVLGDSADSPRFVETLPRRGYRFLAPVESAQTTDLDGALGGRQRSRMPWVRPTSLLSVVLVLLAAAGFFIYRRLRVPASSTQRALTRLTFDDGLQIGATWSPDGRFIAYSSNRGGKFDIWVQQVSGGDPIQITKGPGPNWQPDWSPDGKYIAYRSEDSEGGLFVVPALGGQGLERRIAPFGYYPRWSPNSSQILFQTARTSGLNAIYVVDLDGSAPREILAEFLSRNPHGLHWHHLLYATWHPDGKRASLWIAGESPSPSFWTVPIAGGAAVESVIPPDVAKQFGDVAVGGGRQEWVRDSKFSWAPSGRAIYFERTFRGARNIWKMTVDPNTLQPTAIERMTTGPGLDTEFAVSADGRMAFTVETQHIRAWLFPFDVNRGRVTGAGHAVTSSGVEVTGQSLTQDGKKLAFSGNRAGKQDLWEKSLVDGREAPIVADNYNLCCPRWSRDGTRLAYIRDKAGRSQLMMWSSQSRNEEPLTTSGQTYRGVQDWSPDGKWLLLSQGNNDTHRAELWLLPVAARPHAEAASRKITSSLAYHLFDSQFSPDGRWIVFEAVKQPPTPNAESALYVMPAAGGPWTRFSEGEHWDDKPRWSPDGNMIYFVSDRSGFFNVWGIHFDATKGKPVGEPFRVTAFETPALMLPAPFDKGEPGITRDHLVLTLEERSGSVWVLDNVDR